MESTKAMRLDWTSNSKSLQTSWNVLFRQNQRFPGNNDNPLVWAAACPWGQIRDYFLSDVLAYNREIAGLKFEDIGTALQRRRLGVVGVRVWTKSAQQHEVTLELFGQLSITVGGPAAGGFDRIHASWTGEW